MTQITIQQQIEAIQAIKKTDNVWLNRYEWDGIDAAIATLTSIQLLGEKKVAHCNEAFELLDDLRRSYELNPHFIFSYYECSRITKLLSRISEPHKG